MPEPADATTHEVRAAGGVLWREREDRLEVAVVHRPRYDDWSFPKGKLDPGEQWVTGAVREVREETGFDAVPGRSLGVSRYRVLDRGRDVPKTVQWWAMRATDGAFVPGREVDRLAWLDVAAARSRVTAVRDSAPLDAFLLHPPRTALVLLVRHASAGRAAGFDGPDERRPLDATGRRQAQQLAALLALYAPARVLSAPVLRCLQTVQPLAQRLGLPVQPDDDLPESAVGRLPGRLLDLAALDGTTVACSQGGVIPVAVDRLARSGGLAPFDPRTARPASGRCRSPTAA